jgi:hypothetical protein
MIMPSVILRTSLSNWQDVQGEDDGLFQGTILAKYLEGLVKTTKSHSQLSRCPERDMNRVSLE